MKLVELLAKEMNEWPDMPEGGRRLEQDCNNAVIEGDGCGTVDIFMLSQKADDYAENPHVTRAQWQAERDRQKGGEWKRHRGGKQPVDGAEYVEVKLRDGDIQQSFARCFAWPHSACDVYANIMQYRVISQPQAEEVEVRKFTQDLNMHTPQGEFIRGQISLNDEVIYPAEAQWQQSSGPLAWRDTIIHCQAIIEDCEREIQRNVDLLDAEGLMIQTDSKKSMRHYAPDVLPFEEWQVGDIVASINNYGNQFSVDSEYEIESVEGRRIEITADDCGEKNGWGVDNFRFIRRP
jgi:hypothetical protein